MRKERSRFLGFSLAAVVVGCSTASSVEEPVGHVLEPLTSSQQQKLMAANPGAGDRAGSTVVVSGNNIFLGAPDDDIGPQVNRGSLYVFTRSGSTYAQTQQLSPPFDIGSFDRFSVSVAASGDTLMVGADQANSGSVPDQGAVFVYTRDAQGLFIQQQKLVASDGASGRRFGAAVALAGDTAAVGANDSVYVFERTGAVWAQTQKIDRPGRVVPPSLAMSDDTIVAGFICDTSTASICRGSASIYTRSASTWTEQQLLLASDGLEEDRFGLAVALAGDTVLVGSPGRGQGKGAAYVFVRSGATWSQQQTLMGADSVAGNGFGTAVSLQPDHALIGPAAHDHPGVEPLAGTAYVFTRSGTAWTQREEIRSSDGQNNDFFGSALALSTDIMVVAAPNDDGPVSAHGSAYVFQIQRLPGDPCSTGSECSSGFCSDGRCCNTACTGSCNACSAALGASAEGVCTLLPAGSPGSPACAPSACDGTSTDCVSVCAAEVSPFVQLSAGQSHTCGLRADGTVDCWGYAPFFWGNTPPAGQIFAAIEAGGEHTIALRLDGSLAFWGNDQVGLGSLPSGAFKAIHAGYLHDCALRTDGTAVCWGFNASGQSTPPSGPFSDVGVGATHSCGLRADGTITCWGSNDFGESTPPSGLFQALSVRGQQGCALRADGTVACWGRTDLADWAPPPPGTFKSVQARGVSGCAMAVDHSILCWGNLPESIAPPGQFVHYACGIFHSCAIRPDRSVVCWGSNYYGQSTPP